MRTNKMRTLGVALSTIFLLACQPKDPLPSWNQTEIKNTLIEYISNQAAQIPEEDRIAVFDMDGTISCETPLWFEMAVAVQGMNDLLAKDPSLEQFTEYQYAKKLSINPADTTVLNHWVVEDANYLDSIIMKAFDQMDHEKYIQYARDYLTTAKAPKYDMPYGEMFYQPMLELIEFMRQNRFQIYIVSGSMQGVIWSICPQTIGFDRQHLIGTTQALSPIYPKDKEAAFIIQKSIYQPKNDGDGKTRNIYNRLGKIPVMAVGNTTGDFGMFHLVSTSKYPHLAMMINHDDAQREYDYEPYHGTAVPNWQDSLRINKWIQADMSKEFKTVWMNKK